MASSKCLEIAQYIHTFQKETCIVEMQQHQIINIWQHRSNVQFSSDAIYFAITKVLYGDSCFLDHHV
jgi:hypothetical protein